MLAQGDLVSALEAGDVKRVGSLTRAIFPHLPQPVDAAAAEASMHMARTQMPNVTFKARAYSHRWLTERGFPSQLPDELKPRAERIYPVVTDAVFISANSHSPILKPIMPLVQGAMSDAVEDCYANGDKEPLLVRGRIQEARRKSIKQLVGIGVR